MRRLIWLCSLLPALAWADYKSAYRDGVAAAERGEWSRAEALMREALASESTASPRMRLYGMVYAPYIPQFYLGQAAFNQNDCKAALQWLNAPQASAIVAALQRESQARQMMIDRCNRRLALESAPATSPASTPPAETRPPPTPPVTSRPPPAETARPAVATIDPAQLRAIQLQLDAADSALAAAGRSLADPGLSAQRAPWNTRLSTLDAEAKSARRLLSEARTRGDASALARAEPAARALRQRAEALSAELASAAQQARSDGLAVARKALELAIATGQATQSAVGALAATEVRTLAEALAAGQTALSGGDTRTVIAARERLEAAVRGARALQARSELAARVRPRLQPLLNHFLQGNYAQAAIWADDAQIKAAPSAYAHALLIRAAARFELYVLGAEADPRQAEALRSDIRTARALLPGLKPSERAFSPRFRAYFDRTR